MVPDRSPGAASGASPRVFGNGAGSVRAGAEVSLDGPPCSMDSGPFDAPAGNACGADRGSTEEAVVGAQPDATRCGGGSDCGPHCAKASEARNTASQRPQRTQPSANLNWSRTTLNVVLHEGQQVASDIGR